MRFMYVTVQDGEFSLSYHFMQISQEKRVCILGPTLVFQVKLNALQGAYKLMTILRSIFQALW